jgi:hypothetical protein
MRLETYFFLYVKRHAPASLSPATFFGPEARALFGDSLVRKTIGRLIEHGAQKLSNSPGRSWVPLNHSRRQRSQPESLQAAGIKLL